MSRINTSSDLDSAFLLLCFAWTEEGCPEPPIGYPLSGIRPDTPLQKLPWLLVRSALWALLSNLLHLQEANDSEALHQARIGWRRLRSTMRLLRRLDGLPPPPETTALKPLIASLGGARNVDVARLEVLRKLQRICQQTAQPLPEEWHRLVAALDSEARRHAKAIQLLLKGRTAGNTLWELVLWLEQLESLGSQAARSAAPAQETGDWVHHRLEQLHARYKTARDQASDPERQHRTRILAKRLRYATEDFAALAQHRYRKWHKKAMRYQSKVGLQRDTEMTIALAEQYGAHRVAMLLRETLLSLRGSRKTRLAVQA